MKTSSIIRGICFCIAFSALVSNASAQSAIVSPAGGEQVVAGSVRTISWNTSLVTGMLTLSLWDGGHGKWSTIWANVPSEEGHVSWAVPSNLEGNKFRVKLSPSGTVSGSALSRTFFSIVPPPQVASVQEPGITSPIVCTVHPNPAVTSAKVCVEQLPDGIPATVEVVDALGQHVTTLYNATPEGDMGLCMSLDCSKLASGTYYARVMNDVMGRAVKLSVEH